MALLTLDSALLAAYGVFWQFWPQFEQTHGERHLVGYEVELIGSHTTDINHIDPDCPDCRHVRSVLLKIANLLEAEPIFSQQSLTCNTDSHSNSILCLPALGNRFAVSVSIYVLWNGTNGQLLETNLLTEIKLFLAQWGIHQR